MGVHNAARQKKWIVNYLLCEWECKFVCVCACARVYVRLEYKIQAIRRAKNVSRIMGRLIETEQFTGHISGILLVFSGVDTMCTPPHSVHNTLIRPIQFWLIVLCVLNKDWPSHSQQPKPFSDGHDFCHSRKIGLSHSSRVIELCHFAHVMSR